MTYHPAPAPRHRVYHRDWRTAFIANSERGAELARECGCHWTDNDFHLSKFGLAWINDHGSPSTFWLPRHDRIEHHTAADLLARKRDYKGHTYRLRTLRQTLEDNHHNGLSTEIEVKDIHPWDTPAILDAAMGRIARHAHAVYGAGWRDHVVVKVLTNLAGGEEYALEICAAAHAHGIPTMLLVRGRCRWHRYADHQEVTYVRGSAVIR